ncbi:MAG: nitrophenyl compound nitroreductase subunit ArsF family protein [Cyclobacteriaceae bacterium]|nr:hypothetical protein [Cyclobacteriaceae bacterium]MCH8514829.1 nitrophenyl compound nitroreductase subunit ArsF family protein [Cyclobacteriaceae bacterium]
MKTIFYFALSIVIIGITACGNDQQQSASSEATTASSFVGIEVIDFHSTHRCMTCNSIEEKTKATLGKHFAEALNSEQIIFKTINVDDDANYELAKKFEASGTALFLHLSNGEKSEIVNMTEFAFMNARAEGDKFELGLKESIDQLIQKL